MVVTTFLVFTSCGESAGPDMTEPQVFVRTLSIALARLSSVDTVLTVSGNFADISIHGTMLRGCKGLAERMAVVEHTPTSIDLNWISQSPGDVDCTGQSDIWEYEAFVYNIEHGQYSFRVLYDGVAGSVKYSGLVEVGAR
jgi:hypothetical protein